MDIHIFVGYTTSNILETTTPRVPKQITSWSVGIFTTSKTLFYHKRAVG